MTPVNIRKLTSKWVRASSYHTLESRRTRGGPQLLEFGCCMSTLISPDLHNLALLDVFTSGPEISAESNLIGCTQKKKKRKFPTGDPSKGSEIRRAQELVICGEHSEASSAPSGTMMLPHPRSQSTMWIIEQLPIA